MKRLFPLIAALVFPIALVFSCAAPTDSTDLSGETTGEGGGDSSSGDTGGYGGATTGSTSATSSATSTSGSTSGTTTTSATSSGATTTSTTTSSTTTSASTGGGCDPITCITQCLMTGEIGQCVGADCVCMDLLDGGLPDGFP